MKKLMLLLAASLLVYTTEAKSCPCNNKSSRHHTAKISKRTSGSYSGYRRTTKLSSSRLRSNSRLNNNMNNNGVFDSLSNRSMNNMNNGRKF